MCKTQMLRTLVNQRLNVAVDEIFLVLERTIAEFEEELSRTKEDNERQRQLLDAVFNNQVVLQRADVYEEHISPEQQEFIARVEQEPPQPCHIKEEDQLHSPEELEKFPEISVTVKNEDDGDKDEHKEKLEVQPSSSSSTQHMTTEADGGSQADNLLAPLSDRYDPTSNAPDTDDEDPKADMTYHTDHTYFKCSQCDKTFNHRCSLKRHTKTHTGEKPFVCSICGKTFYQKADFKIHTRIHTGEKPFPCSVCGAGFVRSQHLKRHMRIHTGENTYSCVICSKSFCERTALVVHMRRHTGEKVFSCNVCNERFFYKYQINNHKCAHENSSRK
ncbi:uncharacterized protein [Nerophis lumbriciformis]|uniref:uncharacterized protein n=1 Tax=Nerophis lumbriciformis TaxID=546530 RepID=UPI002AE0B1AC|nr:zinc finger protein 80-like [Nerophis lumbriciformis]XP_061785839.1 zinc finger protein 80-like [Nerophis lumbriciformis]